MNSESTARIEVRDLWKTFRFYRHPLHRFSSWVTRGRYGAPTPFHALRGVSFDVPPGTSVGLLGANGAGKSTLLKLLTGTLEPTAGTVAIEGRVASLLELGTGFHTLFTGRQNIFYNARFLGLSEEEIKERLPGIEEFSELGDFLDRPLRTYSSGMQLRLAFAVAASVSPDVLIIDEVLAVGDAYFQPKCIRRIREFRDQGVTILFVSHDPGAVKTLCDSAILLHDGRILDAGRPAEVLEHYNALIARKKANSDLFAVEADADRRRRARRRSGSSEALIVEIELLDADGQPTRVIVAGAPVAIRVRVFFFVPLEDPTVGILIRDRLGNDVYGTNTFHQQVLTGRWSAGQTLEVRFHLPLALGPGEYSLTAAAHSLGIHLHESYDWFEGGLVFRVMLPDERRSIGVSYFEPRIETGPAATPGSPGEVIRNVFGDPPSSFRVDENGASLLRGGWHDLEGEGADAYRWTERECTFILSLERPQLCLEVDPDRPPGTPAVELGVHSLGRELGRVTLEPGWHEVTLPLPADQPRGPTHLRLVVSDGWKPSETGHGDDTRVLGVRVRRIWSPGPE